MIALLGIGAVGAVVAVPSSSATFNGFPYDRVQPHDGDGSLEPGSGEDALYVLDVAFPGSHTITYVEVRAGGSVWNTRPDGLWIAGVTGSTVGASFLHTYDADISLPFSDAKTVWVYMQDDGSQASGATFDVTTCFDGDDTLCTTTQVTPAPDVDQDGYPLPADCAPSDAAVNPGATEVPDNEVDEDCDGEALHSYYVDGDGDGYGTGDAVGTAASPPAGHATKQGDCDDTEDSVNPGASEVAGDGTDSNCDGADGIVYYPDGDADTYGDSSAPVVAAEPPSGHTSTGGDCDDANADVHPGATETAGNGIDEDCDGADARTWYADADDDGFGDPASSSAANDAPPGHVADATDCDDANADVHPGAAEVPGNDVDEDCDGADAKAWYADADADGFGDPASSSAANEAPAGHVADSTDCDDADADVHPGATETAGNDIDEDCDGADAKAWYADADADGFGDPASSSAANDAPPGHVADATDCDDANADVHPGATETAGNGIDEDCDGADATPVANAPVAGDQTVDTTEDTAVTVTLSATDADDDDLTFIVTGGPSHGTLGSLGTPDCSAADVCTATVDYTPGANYNGSDTFTFTVMDSTGLWSGDGTVTVRVASAADATTFGPVASSNGYFTNKGTRVTISSVVRSTDPACVAGRVVTFTLTGGALSSPLVLTDTSATGGAVSVQATLQPGTYSVALSTPATAAGASPETSCAAGAAAPAGTVVIKSTKKPR